MKRSFLALLVVFGLSFGAVPQTRKQTATRVSVSAPRLALSDGERVGAFEFSLTAGMVQSISNLPKGWYVVVDNDASWRTQVKGNTTVGAAALSGQEFQQLRLIVEQDETDLKFDLTGTVSVTKDFVKERRVRLTRNDFAVSPQ